MTNIGNKLIIKNTAYLYIRMLLTLIIGLYTSRVVLKELGFVDYGLQNILNSLLYLLVFINGSLYTSACRFFSFEIGNGSTKGLNDLFCMTINIHALLSLVVLVLAETLGLWYFFNVMNIPPNRLDACFVAYQSLIFSFILSIMAIPYTAIIIAHEQMKAFAYLSIANVVAKLLIAVSLIICPVDKLITYSILGSLLSIAVQCLYMMYCRKQFKETYYKWVWNQSLFKSLSGFTGWSMFSYTRFVIDQASDLMINFFLGPLINASKAVSAIVQQQVFSFVSNFQMALNPQIIKSCASENYDRTIELVNMSQKLSFSLLFVISFPIIVNIDFILKLWLCQVPIYTNELTVIVLISSIFSSLNNPLSVIIEAANRLKFQNLVLLPFYSSSVIWVFLLLKNGGTVTELILIFLIYDFLVFFVKLIITNQVKRLPVVHLLVQYGKMSILILVSLLLFRVIYEDIPENTIGFISKALITFTYAVICIVLFILNTKEKAIAWNYIKRRI